MGSGVVLLHFHDGVGVPGLPLDGAGQDGGRVKTGHDGKV